MILVVSDRFFGLLARPLMVSGRLTPQDIVPKRISAGSYASNPQRLTWMDSLVTNEAGLVVRASLLLAPA